MNKRQNDRPMLNGWSKNIILRLQCLRLYQIPLLMKLGYSLPEVYQQLPGDEKSTATKLNS